MMRRDPCTYATDAASWSVPDIDRMRVELRKMCSSMPKPASCDVVVTTDSIRESLFHDVLPEREVLALGPGSGDSMVLLGIPVVAFTSAAAARRVADELVGQGKRVMLVT